MISIGVWAFGFHVATVNLLSADPSVLNLVARHSAAFESPNIAGYALVAAGQAYAALLVAYKVRQVSSHSFWSSVYNAKMLFRLHWKAVKVSLGTSRFTRTVAMLSIIAETGIVYSALMASTQSYSVVPCSEG